MIERPTRTVYDWYGLRKYAPRAGHFLRSASGRVWLILEALPVKVRVSRGETVRLRMQLMPWREALTTENVVYTIEWVNRGRR